ncbi:MAG TPA: NADH-ubiquinone oxidoreductase-F iron-sulfur binding region domain-containing protein [Fimbriiglobus sp.]|jgi:NADH:ubiquinone oxidoreductase subunit F (NADH-binding)/NADH:ubiquinone oxidoreductase subunit E
MIVQRLRAIQDEFGYLPDAELRALASATGTPLARIQEVVSFFPHFRAEWNKPPFVHVQVCRDLTCHLRGAAHLLGLEGLGECSRPGADSEDRNRGAVVVDGVSCLGRCDRAPVICVTRLDHRAPGAKPDSYPGHGEHQNQVHERIYAGRSPAEYGRIVRAVIAGESPAADTDAAHAVHSNPVRVAGSENSRWLIDPYAQNPEFKPYQAALNFLALHPAPVKFPDALKAKGTKPDAVTAWAKQNYPTLSELYISGLLGMGGAGMPAFVKWLEVWKAEAEGNEKYIVCNGDESEPGTFKDRELLLQTPHLVVEGVILAGLITNATAGYIFIRHEYPEQIAAVNAAIQLAVAAGVCGHHLLGKPDRSFPVEVFTSPGGYICGEQSALLEAMSDRRGQPRNRPPELYANGLRDKPTVVNNVETLAWSPAIALNGGEWYVDQSVSPLKGRRIFSVSGDVTRPGVYEVPVGATLGDLIGSKDYCGGIRDRKRILALATSGPSGGILPALLPMPDEAELDKRIREMLAEGLFKVREDLRQSKASVSDIQDAEARQVAKFRAQSLTPYLTAIPFPQADGSTTTRTYFDLLKMPLDLNQFKAYNRLLGIGGQGGLGMMLGAGIVVYAEGTDILSQAVNFTEFFRNESCGKCVPCRIGSQKLTEIGTQLLARRKDTAPTRRKPDNSRRVIATMTEAMVSTSICSLGQVASNPLITALTYFPEAAPKSQGNASA